MFQMKKSSTVSHYSIRLELRGPDVRRFLSNPDRYMQSQLNQQGYKWRSVKVHFKKGAPGTDFSKAVIIIIIGNCAHVDFGNINGATRCDWVIDVKEVIVIFQTR